MKRILDSDSVDHAVLARAQNRIVEVFDRFSKAEGFSTCNWNAR